MFVKHAVICEAGACFDFASAVCHTLDCEIDVAESGHPRNYLINISDWLHAGRHVFSFTWFLYVQGAGPNPINFMH